VRRRATVVFPTQGVPVMRMTVLGMVLFSFALIVARAAR
jgi:hypothetical protein